MDCLDDKLSFLNLLSHYNNLEKKTLVNKQIVSRNDLNGFT